MQPRAICMLFHVLIVYIVYTALRRTCNPSTLYLFKLPLKALRYLDSVLIEMHMSFLCLSPFLLKSRSCVYIHDRNKTLQMLM